MNETDRCLAYVRAYVRAWSRLNELVRVYRAGLVGRQFLAEQHDDIARELDETLQRED